MTKAQLANWDFSNGEYKLHDDNGNVVYFEDESGYWCEREYNSISRELCYYRNSGGEESGEKKGIINSYSFYLFSLLFHETMKEVIEGFEDIPYDRTFEMVSDTYNDFLKSDFNSEDSTKYDCMDLFLTCHYKLK